jgi:hypothetical protein
MLNTGHTRFPERKMRQTIRGGIYAWCPNERRVLSTDEVRRMVLPPGREVCVYCGYFVDKHIDPHIFG